jgi:hypothetical protein
MTVGQSKSLNHMELKYTIGHEPEHTTGQHEERHADQNITLETILEAYFYGLCITHNGDSHTVNTIIDCMYCNTYTQYNHLSAYQCNIEH